MEDKKSNIRLIVIYLVITYFVSGIGYLIWFQPKQNEFAAFIPILGPLFGAITVYFITKRKINLMINKISVSGIITGAFIPVIYVLSLGCIFLITGNQFKSADVTGKEIVILLIQWIFAGVCEEIGWRGVVFPVLNRIVKFSTACIFTGIFWAIWHIPMIYGGIIVTQQPKFMAIFMFCAETIIMSFILGIISRSEMGKSLWTYVTWHALHNVLFIVFSKFLPKSSYTCFDDGGYISTSVLLCIALVVWSIYKYQAKKIYRKYK